MKKIILLVTVILTLASCERQSGRRVPETKLYIIEYVDNNTDNIIEVRFASRYSASQYRNSLDSLDVWSRLYSEPINKINSIDRKSTRLNSSH